MSNEADQRAEDDHRDPLEMELADLRKAISLGLALEQRDVEYTNMHPPIAHFAKMWKIEPADDEAVKEWDKFWQ